MTLSIYLHRELKGLVHCQVHFLNKMELTLSSHVLLFSLPGKFPGEATYALLILGLRMELVGEWKASSPVKVETNSWFY